VLAVELGFQHLPGELVAKAVTKTNRYSLRFTENHRDRMQPPHLPNIFEAICLRSGQNQKSKSPESRDARTCKKAKDLQKSSSSDDALDEDLGHLLTGERTL
jgi:hypothetical protein